MGVLANLALVLGYLLPSPAMRPGPELLIQKHASTPSESKSAKFAYVWYLADADADIACAVLVAASSVSNHTLGPNVDRVVIYDREVPGKERFEHMGIQMIKVEEAASKGQSQWRDSFLKLRAAELFQYTRIVYFDVDAFPLGSLDNLFDIAKFPVEIAAPRAYWLPQPFVQSGGPMVIDPRRVFYERDFAEPMTSSVGEMGGEMDWVNAHFRDQVDVLDGFYALLIGEWCGSDGIYRYWQKRFRMGPDWVMQNAAIVHFIADWKPWRITTPDALASRCPEPQAPLLQVFQKWWSARARVC